MKTSYFDKKSFRAKAKVLRDNINAEKYSREITEKINGWEIYNNAKNIMIFSPIKSEISLLALLENKEKNFYFPVVVGENIYPVKYNPQAGFTEGKYGISEPIGDIIKDYNEIDVVFLPALAADRNGFRLGYGKGYYDRFLQHISPRTTKVLPICSKLVYDCIPKESHDMPADCLITEKQIISIKD